VCGRVSPFFFLSKTIPQNISLSEYDFQKKAARGNGAKATCRTAENIQSVIPSLSRNLVVLTLPSMAKKTTSPTVLIAKELA